MGRKSPGGPLGGPVAAGGSGGAREERERRGRERRRGESVCGLFWRAKIGAFSADNIATKTKANLCSYSGGAVDPPSLTAGDGESGVRPGAGATASPNELKNSVVI